MKISFLNVSIICFIVICISLSCKKNNVTTISPQDISGNWKWLDTYHDWAPGPNNPSTPLNTGIQETLTFNSDKIWEKIQNNNIVDSGTYALGHGHYLPYQGAYDYIYDSVLYYKNGQPSGYWDYYKISNDTLTRGGSLAGSIGADASFYVKQ